VGESLVDVVHTADGRVTEHPGGSPANVAIALARLDRRCLLATDFAPDRLGQRLTDHFHEAGVDLVVPPHAGSRTSSAIATIGSDGSASYDFDLRWDIAAPMLTEPPLVVHTGSLAALITPGADVVHHLLTALRPSSTITYDVNFRPQVLGRVDKVLDRVHALAGISDVVKASDEDLAHLYDGLATVEAASRLLSLGPAAVVVTLGGKGALALTRQGRVDVDTRVVPVADTIGAGDSFTAAMLDELWALGLLGAATRETLGAAPSDSWRRVLEHACAAAAITVSRPGADPPWRAELPVLTV
jgi:fructokinase